MIGIIKKLNNNPVYIREITVQDRQNSRKNIRIPACTGYLAILLLPVTIAILFSMSGNQLNTDDLKTVFMITVFLQVLYYIYIGASHTWGLISGENEMRTYGNLISTGMSPDEIIQGKFWAAFFPPAKELTYLFPVFAAIGLLLQIHPFFLIQIYLLTLLFMALFSMVGMYSDSGKLIMKFHVVETPLLKKRLFPPHPLPLKTSDAVITDWLNQSVITAF